MRILQIARRYVRSDWGGTENVVSNLTREILLRGHYTELWTSSALSQPGSEMLEGVPTRRFDYLYPYFGIDLQARRRMDMKGGNMLSPSMLKELLLRPDFDVYHLHTGKRLGAQAAFAARMRNKPFVLTLHGGMFGIPEAEERDLLKAARGSIEWGKLAGALLGSRSLVHDADAVLCVNPAEVDEIRSRYIGKLALHLPNGVNIQSFENGDGRRFKKTHGFKPEDRLVVCIGRIDHQKNQAALLDAFARLAAPENHLHLVLIGPRTNDEYAEKLQSQAVRLGVDHRFHMFPPMSMGSEELADAYRSAAVFAVPSLHEPFGIVALEAWAAKRAVVAARVGGLAHFIEDGRDGLLFSHDEPDGLYMALKAVLENRNLARRLGEAGYAKARDHYGWGGITERLLDLYERLIRSRK